MNEKKHSNRGEGYLLVLTAGILWGTIGLFVSLLSGLGAESQLISVLRIGVAALVLIPIMLATGGIESFKADKHTILSCLAMGILCQAVFNFSYSESISHVGVATGAILLYTAPIFVCIMSRIFFKEKIGKVKVIALFVNIIGCVLTVTGGNFTDVNLSLYGVATGIGAGFFYGLMTILSTPISGKNNPLTILFYQFLFGAIALAIFTNPFAGIGDLISTKFILYALGYGLIPTIGSYFVYVKGLSCDVETSKVPVIASIETVVAALIGIFAFSEDIGFVKIIGIAVVIGSIVIMNMVKSPNDGEPDIIEEPVSH